MNRLFLFSGRQVWLSLGFTALVGCTSGEFPTLTIYDTPHAFVRLQADPMIERSVGHSHPANVSTEQMAAVLQGIIVQEPMTRLPLYDDLSIPRRHRAFDEDAVIFWAPLLSLAFSKAMPEEVVTFYQSRRLSGVNREVTSGGMFLDGEDLHVLLSNYRSDTHSTADIGVADTLDDRLTPLHSLAPQKGMLSFEPAEFQQATELKGTGTLFHWDRRELILQVNRLPVKPLSSEPSPIR